VFYRWVLRALGMALWPNRATREARSNKVAQNGWARVVLGVNSF